MDSEATLRRANEWAQQCFHAMLELGCYGDPTAPATIRYIAAERRVDDLLLDAQWDHAKAEMDGLQAADHDYHTYAAYFDPLCDSCTYTQGSLQQPVYR